MRSPTVGHLIRKVSSPRTVLQLRTDAAADRSDAYSSLLQCIAVPSRVGLSVCPSGADSPLQYSGSFPHRLGYQKCDNQHGTNGASNLDDFVQYWGLNEDALDRLYKLPGDMQEQAISGFSPPADTRDISGKFISFTVKLAGKGAGKGEKGK